MRIGGAAGLHPAPAVVPAAGRQPQEQQPKQQPKQQRALQPDPPRLRQISAICRNGMSCSWWVSTLVDTFWPARGRIPLLRNGL
ncbi:hypothetical protein DM611_12750 [Stenotrophomonas maltophilia]|nr:hypothetical protein DM611_12750 [Stenotrophomonas maltophilia]MBA0360050.1 hypothetical protein [Stenotrophomonas maltophilia]